jgi:hypothetical protein
MFFINTETAKPDIKQLLTRADMWAARGVRLNAATWHELIEIADEKAALLRSYGLKKPNSQRELSWFLRSFNSLDIAETLYSATDGRWLTSIKALEEMSARFNSTIELRTLYEYKLAQSAAQSFRNYDKHLDAAGLVFPRVSTTVTNRVMFVEPYISGLPSKSKAVLPLKNGNTLYSVDIVSQEPNIIIHWAKDKALSQAIAKTGDIYTGVAKMAFAPKVKKEKDGDAYTEIVKCGTWATSDGDRLMEIQNVPKSAAFPQAVEGILTGGRVMLFRVLEGGLLDTQDLVFSLSEAERDEVKKVWNVLAYGGALASARAECRRLEAKTLVDYVNSVVKKVSIKDNGHSLFGTPLDVKTAKSAGAEFARTIQGTGADLLALLVERFYEVKPAGADIYYTRFDEIIVEADSNGLADELCDIFTHTLDGETIMRANVTAY